MSPLLTSPSCAPNTLSSLAICLLHFFTWTSGGGFPLSFQAEIPIKSGSLTLARPSVLLDAWPLLCFFPSPLGAYSHPLFRRFLKLYLYSDLFPDVQIRSYKNPIPGDIPPFKFNIFKTKSTYFFENLFFLSQKHFYQTETWKSYTTQSNK